LVETFKVQSSLGRKIAFSDQENQWGLHFNCRVQLFLGPK
jgi:hypothetical protein